VREFFLGVNSEESVWSREDYAVERIIQRIEHLEEECMIQRIQMIQRIYSRAEHIIQSTSSKVHPPKYILHSKVS